MAKEERRDERDSRDRLKRRSRNEREPYSTKLSLPFVSVPWKKKGESVESCAWIIRGISHEGNEIYSQLFSRAVTVFERRMEITNSLYRKRPDLSSKLRTRSYGNISLPLIFVFGICFFFSKDTIESAIRRNRESIPFFFFSYYKYNSKKKKNTILTAFKM